MKEMDPHQKASNKRVAWLAGWPDSWIFSAPCGCTWRPFEQLRSHSTDVTLRESILDAAEASRITTTMPGSPRLLWQHCQAGNSSQEKTALMGKERKGKSERYSEQSLNRFASSSVVSGFLVSRGLEVDV